MYNLSLYANEKEWMIHTLEDMLYEHYMKRNIDLKYYESHDMHGSSYEIFEKIKEEIKNMEYSEKRVCYVTNYIGWNNRVRELIDIYKKLIKTEWVK
jgi:uncharacterized protein YajQ (UPF0234 family)